MAARLLRFALARNSTRWTTRRMLCQATERQLEMWETATPDQTYREEWDSLGDRLRPALFENGDRLEDINLPDFAPRDIKSISRVTVMIANPRAGHYLVGEENEEEGKFSRAGCVELPLQGDDPEPLCLSRDESIREKVWQFIDQYDKMEFGHVNIWPELAPVNDHFPGFGFPVEDHKVKVVLLPREAIRLTRPSGPALIFPVYAALLPHESPSSSLDEKASGIVAAEGVQPIEHGPLCVGLARFRSIEKAWSSRLAPALVYLPHAHTCGDDSRVGFTPSQGENSNPESALEDLRLFKECFMRAHGEGKTPGFSLVRLRALERRTLDLQFPNGHCSVIEDNSGDNSSEEWIALFLKAQQNK